MEKFIAKCWITGEVEGSTEAIEYVEFEVENHGSAIGLAVRKIHGNLERKYNVSDRFVNSRVFRLQEIGEW